MARHENPEQNSDEKLESNTATLTSDFNGLQVKQDKYNVSIRHPAQWEIV